MQMLRIMEKKRAALGILDLALCLAVMQMSNLDVRSNVDFEESSITGPIAGITPFNPFPQPHSAYQAKFVDDYDNAMNTYRTIMHDAQARVPSWINFNHNGPSSITTMMLRVGRDRNETENIPSNSHLRGYNLSSSSFESTNNSGNHTVPAFDLFNVTSSQTEQDLVELSSLLLSPTNNFDNYNDVRWRGYLNDQRNGPEIPESNTNVPDNLAANTVGGNTGIEGLTRVRTTSVFSEESGIGLESPASAAYHTEASSSSVTYVAGEPSDDATITTSSTLSPQYESSDSLYFHCDTDSELDCDYLEDSDIMQLMYQQDVDLGFSWPASDHLKSLKQLDDISTIKQQNESTGEFFVDGETGEHIPLSKVQNNTQPKKEKVVEETPQVSQPDKSAQPSNYFSIDEYLEFLDNTIDDLQPQVVEQMAPNQDNVIGGLVDLVENGGNTVTVDETPEDIWQDIANLSELTGIDLNVARQTDPVHTLINSNVSLTNASVEMNQLQPNINQPFQPQVLDNVNNTYNKTLNYEPEQPFVTRPCNVYETPAYNQFGPYGEPAYGSPPYNPMNGEDGTPMDTVLSPGMPTPTFSNFQAPMETGDSRSYGGSSPMMGFPAEPGQMIFDGATNMNEMLNDIININSTNQVYGNKMTPDFMNINQAPYIPPPLNSSPPPLVTFLDDSNPLVGSSSNESCDSDSGVSMEQSPQSFYMGNQRMGRHSIEPEPVLLDQSFQRNKMKSINHNHTYDGTVGKPKTTKKKEKPSNSRESRDEKKARELNIPFTLDEIVMSPVEEYNEMLVRTPLTAAQQALIKDIRRRGKNKVAAQNCRKRKIDTISTMEEDVDILRVRKTDLELEQDDLELTKEELKTRYNALYQQIFRSLRDDAGRPYDPSRYALEQVQGAVLLVPSNISSHGGVDGDFDFSKVKMEKRE